jgi:hypothetical protein
MPIIMLLSTDHTHSRKEVRTMWKMLVKLDACSGKLVVVSAEADTRQELVSILKKMDIEFIPDTFWGPSDSYRESESMYQNDRECVYLTRE